MSLAVLQLFCSLFFSRPRSEGWPHHGRTFSIYLCPLSFWLTLQRGVLSTSWCCPFRQCVVFLACVHLTLFLALSLSLSLSLSVAISIYYRKLGSRRGTARRAASVEILSAVTKHFTVQLWKQVEQCSFSNRVINRWNQLVQRVVDASSINAFKGCLNKIRETRMGFFMDWSAEP